MSNLRMAVFIALVSPVLVFAQPLRKPPVPPPWLKPWQPPAVPKNYQSPDDIHKVMVERRDARTVTRGLRPINALHYQGRTLLVVNTADLQSMVKAGTLRDDLNLIRLRDRVIDTTVPPPPVPDAMKLTPRDQRQLHLVQFAGPVQPDWKKTLEKVSGLDIVTYFPENAYLVWATPAARQQLASQEYLQPHVQWQGPFHPDYKLHPAFDRTFPGNVQATVQVYAHEGAASTIEAIRSKATAVLKEPRQSGAYINIIIEVPASQLESIARLEDVVNVEPFLVPQANDERQGQILAGSVNGAGTGPNAPGYLAWLNGLGFTSNFGFTVDVSDDGFDRGLTDAANVHSVFLDGLGASRVTYVRKVSGTTITTTGDNNIGGHGTLNASIVGGLNQAMAGAGSPITAIRRVTAMDSASLPSFRLDRARCCRGPLPTSPR